MSAGRHLHAALGCLPRPMTRDRDLSCVCVCVATQLPLRVCPHVQHWHWRGSLPVPALALHASGQKAGQNTPHVWRALGEKPRRMLLAKLAPPQSKGGQGLQGQGEGAQARRQWGKQRREEGHLETFAGCMHTASSTPVCPSFLLSRCCCRFNAPLAECLRPPCVRPALVARSRLTNLQIDRWGDRALFWLVFSLVSSQATEYSEFAVYKPSPSACFHHRKGPVLGPELSGEQMAFGAPWVGPRFNPHPEQMADPLKVGRQKALCMLLAGIPRQ